mmetsp:Transcript_13794/g.43158  ORF Transcript_13794/g.43158 Transcript_13794/m.43158 type:complete len:383 (+) Transcript_13794:325-1473(+)
MPAVPPGVDLRLGVFVNQQGLKLQTYRFAPAAGKWKGIVFMLHGIASHTVNEWFLREHEAQAGDRWRGSVLEGLVSAGYAAFALDRQAHGRSEGARGLRCYFRRFADLPAEAEAFMEAALRAEPELAKLPLFLFAQSMGGAVALDMARRAARAANPGRYAGLVLYSPMLSLDRMRQEPFIACCGRGSKEPLCICARSKHLEPLVSCLDCMCPTMPLVKGSPKQPANLRHLEAGRGADPLMYNGKARVRVAKACVDITNDFLRGGLEEVEVPFVVFQCQRDGYVDPQGAERLYERAACAPEDKRIVRIGPGQDIAADMFHVLSVEPGHAEVFAAALGFIEERARQLQAPGRKEEAECEILSRPAQQEMGAEALLPGHVQPELA